MSGFTFTCTCLQCGGALDSIGPARVADIEAYVRVVCRDCRAGATLRVLYSNRAEMPVTTRSIDP